MSKGKTKSKGKTVSKTKVNSPVKKSTKQKQLEIGEQALSGRYWIPLDSRYSNTKGIKPDRIDWLINQFPENRTPNAEQNWERFKRSRGFNQPIIDEGRSIEDLINNGFTQADISNVISNTTFYNRRELFKASKRIHIQHKRLRDEEKQKGAEFVFNKFNKIENDLESGEGYYHVLEKAFTGIYQQSKPDPNFVAAKIRRLFGLGYDAMVLSGEPLYYANRFVKESYHKYDHFEAVSLLKWVYDQQVDSGKLPDTALTNLLEKYKVNNEPKMSKTDLVLLTQYVLINLENTKRSEISFNETRRYETNKILSSLGLSDLIKSYRTSYSDSDLEAFVEEIMLRDGKYDNFKHSDFNRLGLKELEQEASELIEQNSGRPERQTIYVTSPRGGHELLSIYAYANGLEKENIPSDIIHKGEVNLLDPSGTEFRSTNAGMELIGDIHTGITYLGDTTGRDIARVVIVDDVVGSGQQMSFFYKTLRKKFPLAHIYYNTIAHRKKEYQTEDFDRTLKEVDNRTGYIMAKAGFSGVSYDLETIGIQGYARGESGSVGVVFPHAIPDGSTDAVSRLLVQAKDESMRNVGSR